MQASNQFEFEQEIDKERVQTGLKQNIIIEFMTTNL